MKSILCKFILGSKGEEIHFASLVRSHSKVYEYGDG